MWGYYDSRNYPLVSPFSTPVIYSRHYYFHYFRSVWFGVVCFLIGAGMKVLIVDAFTKGDSGRRNARDFHSTITTAFQKLNYQVSFFFGS